MTGLFVVMALCAVLLTIGILCRWRVGGKVLGACAFVVAIIPYGPWWWLALMLGVSVLLFEQEW